MRVFTLFDSDHHGWTDGRTDGQSLLNRVACPQLKRRLKKKKKTKRRKKEEEEEDNNYLSN